MANISEVAALAGVSRQTVSRVLNDGSTVSPATRSRVDDAIRRLNYRPSAAARALVTRRTRTIGLVTTGAPLYGPSSTMLAFNEAARAAGYRVVTASLAAADRAAVVDAIDVLLGQDIEALVLIATDYESLDAVDGLRLDIPLVTAESSGRPGRHSVSIDQFDGARMMTEHLVALGHRGILHLSGPTDSVDASERVRGWRAALEHHGLSVAGPIVGDWQPASGYRAASELAERFHGGEATALFCANDQMAVGALHAFADRGVRVPQQVSVAGFDDIPEAAHFLPPLTTVRQDFAELGVRLMAVVTSVLQAGSSPQSTTTAPELIVRASTGEVAHSR